MKSGDTNKVRARARRERRQTERRGGRRGRPSACQIISKIWFKNTRRERRQRVCAFEKLSTNSDHMFAYFVFAG